MIVQTVATGYWTKIKINGLPHVVFRSEDFLGFESHIELRGVQEYFIIEYHLKDKSIVTEFDERRNWLAMLKKLDEHFC
jgi:hypothetical protein